ncbi:hypothetical protein ACWDFR_45325 [Streptomyces sp. 900105755]
MTSAPAISPAGDGVHRTTVTRWVREAGKVRTDPRWATALVRALLVLTNKEVAR